MCLVLFAYRHHPAYELVLLANRDEFHERPTAAAAFWDDGSGALAGRDLRGGGAWMGITRAGRYAAVTNYRDLKQNDPGAPSRGALVANYLWGIDLPEAYMARIAMKQVSYNGYNLIAGDPDNLCYFSNREGIVRRLEPGLYGLSNHLLDTPWFKVERGKTALHEALASGHVAPESLFEILADDTTAPPEMLPDTGVGAEWEQVLSPRFIKSPSYGTRSSTVMLIDRTGAVRFVERTFAGPEDGADTRTYTFQIERAVPEERQP